MQISIKEGFDFEGAVKDHGWWMLAPNHWDEEKNLYQRPLRLKNKKLIYVSIAYTEVGLEVDVFEELSEKEKDDVAEQVRWIFRLDEDFEPFYALAEKKQALGEVLVQKKGRLLRSPTLFEDITKVILTTNTSWRQTMNMVENLVTYLGEPVPDSSVHAFPTPEKILEAGETFLKEKIRVGYRSSYLIDVAQKALDPQFDLEAYKEPGKNLKDLQAIKGVGPYAFGTISMLLGDYEHLPVDSVFRERVTNKYFNGEKTSKQNLESVYQKWGDYKHLAYWFDFHE